MGLDITAWEVARITPPHEYDGDECYDNDHVRSFTDAFPYSLRGLEEGRCYRVSGAKLRFRAGSYGGYNGWRELLALAALDVLPGVIWRDPADWIDQPFFELINFSDCEGVIGPEACADLAADFTAHRDTMLTDGEEWFIELYDIWRQAFAIAAGTGLVDFH